MPQNRTIVDELRRVSAALSVGVISADFMNLGTDIALLERLGVRLLHFDILDGRFGPALTVGPAFVKGVKTAMLKDVHLMIEEPLETIDAYAAAGADMITVHVESCRHPHRALQRVRELANVNDPSRGIACGVGLCPSTPVAAIEPLLGSADFVLLVAINPGFGNQTYLPDTANRAERVREIARAQGVSVMIGIDGGVTGATIGRIASIHPDLVVTGSAVFGGKGPGENIPAMTAALKGGGQ